MAQSNNLTKFKRGLVLFQNDLRIEDHLPLLNAAQHCERLLCVHILPGRSKWLQHSGLDNLGDHRQHFIQDALRHLDGQLRQFHQRLYLFTAHTPSNGNQENTSQAFASTLTDIIKRHHIDAVFYSDHPGYEERQALALSKAQVKDVAFHCFDNLTLFSRDSVKKPSFYKSYSQFKQLALKRIPTAPKGAPNHLPAPFPVDTDSTGLIIQNPVFQISELPDVGRRHLNQYMGLFFAKGHDHFATPLRRYKDTRNALDDATASSRLSTYLAQGTLSVREVAEQLFQHELQFGQNDSTRWLYFELLWREFFYHYGYHFNQLMFRFSGISGRRPLTSFYPQAFQAWLWGQTTEPLVNASMNQLRETGYISNRARQIAASYLVNEAKLDWRYGAHTFQHYLTDYDVAINWGNWQYIAGVGIDPRGGRHFNIKKQTQEFDPDGRYISRWRGEVAHSPQPFHTDAADWPVERP